MRALLIVHIGYELEAARNNVGGDGIGVPVALPTLPAAASPKAAEAPEPLDEVMLWCPPCEPPEDPAKIKERWKFRK